MCLCVTVELVGLDREAVVSAVDTASQTADVLQVDVTPKRLFGPKTPYLFVTEGGGCACSLLRDDADWEAPTWAMEAHLLRRLAATITALGQSADAPLVFEALWLGDEAEETVELGLEELASLAAASRLGTRTRYVVSARDQA